MIAVRPRSLENPALRLVVFHHAGGSAAAYFPLVHGLPDDWDLVLPDLPGRGKRHGTPALDDMEALVAVATEDVLDWAGPPIAIFGHSLGAIVAAEAARAVQARGVEPVWVGVSGRPAPGQWVETGLDPYRLSDEELMRELTAIGGIPHRIDEVPEFRDRFIRLVRTDLRALGSYRPAPDRAPLTAPLTAFGATGDVLAPPISIAAWAQETTAVFRQRLFTGGHFHFLRNSFPNFARALGHEIQRSMSRRTGAPIGATRGVADVR
jgi:surfactin synthase thioesterase subunit